jgi:hypothetical protein
MMSEIWGIAKILFSLYSQPRGNAIGASYFPAGGQDGKPVKIVKHIPLP